MEPFHKAAGSHNAEPKLATRPISGQLAALTNWEEIMALVESLKRVRSSDSKKDGNEALEEAEILAKLSWRITAFCVDMLAGAYTAVEALTVSEDYAKQRGFQIKLTNRKLGALKFFLDLKIAPIARRDILFMLTATISIGMLSAYNWIVKEYRILNEPEHRKMAWYQVTLHPDLRFYQHLWELDTQMDFSFAASSTPIEGSTSTEHTSESTNSSRSDSVSSQASLKGNAITPVMQFAAVSFAAMDGAIDTLQFLVDQLKFPTSAKFSIEDLSQNLVLSHPYMESLRLSHPDAASYTLFNFLNPICGALAHNRLKSLIFLHSRGARFDISDVKNEERIILSPIIEAGKRGNMESLKWVMEVGLSAEQISSLKGPLGPVDYASQFDNPAILKYLHEERGFPLNELNGLGKLPFHIAANRHAFNTMAYLIEKGVPINCKDRSGGSVYHHASLSDRELPVMKWLAEKNRDPFNEASSNGFPPILHAARKGALKIVQYLHLELGIPLQAPTSRYNVVDLAIMNHHIDLLKWLVESNLANPTPSSLPSNFPINNWVQQCALFGFVEGLELAFDLGRLNVVHGDGGSSGSDSDSGRGIDPNLWVLAAASHSGFTTTRLNLRVSRQIPPGKEEPSSLISTQSSANNVGEESSSNTTACRGVGAEETTRRDPSTLPKSSLTPLTLSPSLPLQENSEEHPSGVVILKWLIKLGFKEINFISASGFNATLAATMSGTLPAFEYLLSLGASISAKTLNGLDLWLLAVDKSKIDFVRCLFSHGLVNNHSQNRMSRGMLIRSIDKDRTSILHWLVEEAGCPLLCYRTHGRWCCSLAMMKYLYNHGIAPVSQLAAKTAFRYLQDPDRLREARWLFKHGASLAYFSQLQPPVTLALIDSFIG